MKILLSYSKLHFDPDKPALEHKYWGSSASILARTLYKILSGLGEVTYLDASQAGEVKGKKYDLFVGIQHNFQQFTKYCRIGKSILFAVNMHPWERNWLFLKFLVKEKLSFKSLAGWDLQSFWSSKKNVAAADYIICLGNIKTYNSFLKHGIKKGRIKVFNYGLEKEAKINVQTVKKHSYLYAVSEIGLRKGFDIIFSLFTDPQIQSLDFKLHLMGLTTNRHYEKKLQTLRKILGKKAVYHGWIDSSSPEYQKIIASCQFQLLPSIEEGQPGTLIEGLQQGLIPLVSENSGIDFAPLGFLETKLDSEENRRILGKSMQLKPNEIADLRKKTADYYREFHHDFTAHFSEAMTGILQGQLYPKISITLPIYNKEKTILKLIKMLDAACRAYGNCELHLFFDGCLDRTEKIVRDFYKGDRGYPVSFQVTPNIFEIRTNNLGMKKSTGKYCCLLQDDNYLLDRHIFFEAVTFMDKNDKVALLGGLAGVNYYPLGYKIKKGQGQIAQSHFEVYHRQDERTDTELKGLFFGVDAVMRGPLFIRNSFLHEHGYLDEIYAPLHQDDMDICFRARKFGYKVYSFLSDSINTSLTVAKYDENENRKWYEIMIKNTAIFYKLWQPTIKKDFLKIKRFIIWRNLSDRLLIVCNRYLLLKDKAINMLFASYLALTRKIIVRT